jgi:stearoyl-CoA desaturase (delta-9 desaturase)
LQLQAANLSTFILVFLLSYLWHAMGTTIGYHRLLSHRSFQCPKFVEYFWVLGGYLAFEGSPIWWASIHRAHHRFTDQPDDPHAPRYGWKHAYFGWIFKNAYGVGVDPNIQAIDLIKDPVYRFLEQNGSWHRAHVVATVIGIAFRLGLLVCFGWVVALASLVAGVVVLQIPLLLNVLCHQPKLGYKTYATEDDSVNVWWVALLTAGEGWHNNHHAFPGSARSGLKAHEFDLSWLTLRFLKVFGLVGNMHEAEPVVR